MRSVAIIDIGSNSIKVLVAARGPDGQLVALKSRTIDARISAGISRAHPQLSESGMQTGLDAIQALLADAAPFNPEQITLVATSAVRDAENGNVFRERVRAATGLSIRILTGDEEANLIGRGLTADPALSTLKDFYVFDLGGGSLECLLFKERTIQQGISLPLGCVRLTERCVANSSEPFTEVSRQNVYTHSLDELRRSVFAFSLPIPPSAVFAGGTMTTTRAIFAARRQQTMQETSPQIRVSEIRELLDAIAPLPLAERQNIPGLPAARADVFPTALTTIVAVAEAGGIETFHHSLYNLRWGLAAEALG